jgi:hypothetical protein
MTERQPRLTDAPPLRLTHAPMADALPASPQAVSSPAGAGSLGVPRDQAVPAHWSPPSRARSPLARAWSPIVVRDWFDIAAEVATPDHDGSLGTPSLARSVARNAALAFARRAKAENTRRAYRAGVPAWCDQHGLPCLPARGADVVAFLAAERGRGLRVNTVELRRAAIRYLHVIAGCPARNSPPPPTSCARSWRRLKPTSPDCATARCC